MTDIILIQPPLSRKERYGVLSSGGSCLPPFGLAWLAAVLREEGYSVSIIDSEAELLSCKEVVSRVLAENPSVVGITGTTISVSRAGDVAHALREQSFSRPIILGGPHVTAVPEATLRTFSSFDVAVTGEGEKTIVQLMKVLTSLRNTFAADEHFLKDSMDEALKGVKGIAFIGANDHYIETPPQEYLSQDELNDLPLPAFDLLPPLNSVYQPSALRSHRLPSSSLITTRGCGGKCTFCDNTVFGNRTRSFSSDYILKMVDVLVRRYGVRDITFYDDNFVVNKKRLKEFCSALKENHPQLSWSCNARVDVINDELVDLVKAAGCWQMSVGIESGDQSILDRECKGITIEQVTKAVHLLHKARIKTKGFFMIGHPGETEETVQKTIDFALQLPLDDFQMSFLTPFPGTCIYKNASQWGELTENWDSMNMWTPVFIPRGFTRERLIELQSKALRSFYFRPSIVFRYFLTCVRTPSVTGAIFRGALSLLKGVFSSRREGIDS